MGSFPPWLKSANDLIQQWHVWGFKNTSIIPLVILLQDEPKGRLTREHQKLQKIHKQMKKDEWIQLPTTLLDLYNDFCTSSPPGSYVGEKKLQHTVLSEIYNAAKYGDSVRSWKLFLRFEAILPYERLRAKMMPHIEFQRRLERWNEIKLCLDKYQFAEADELALKDKLIDYQEYIQIKSKYIESYSSTQFQVSVVNEQAVSLASTSPNTLIHARAGSGKTRVLALKTALLITAYNIHPDQILILAFNKNAASEIRNRVQEYSGNRKFETALTFHSLAYRIVRPTEKLMFDDPDVVYRDSLSLRVSQIRERLMTKQDSKKVYRFFRKESSIPSDGFRSKRELYIYTRNYHQISLRGDRVRSLGEKFIADFLFEHDIKFQYEKTHLWNRQLYHPDFTLANNLGEPIIIEHWGIDENNPSKKVPESWGISWEEYHEEMIAKREYWKQRGIQLFETSLHDLKQGRERFEEYLQKCLEDMQVPCKKRPQREIEREVFDRQISRLDNLLVQFIMRAQKKCLNPQQTAELISSQNPFDEKTSYFLDLAQRTYKAYVSFISENNITDFDRLLMQAITSVSDRENSGSFYIGKGESRREIPLCSLKWVLIDEFQDFSRLFNDMIQTIRKVNPNIKAACVGDDWQAINGFAGSELMYFENFENSFKGYRSTLSLNHRSKQVIVEAGNTVMKGFGQPGRSGSTNDKGLVEIVSIDEVPLVYQKGDNSLDNPDVKYVQLGDETTLRSNAFLIGRYLKACHSIIMAEEHQRKTFAILCRTNRLYGLSLTRFQDLLTDIISLNTKPALDFSNYKLTVDTVHSFKGKEADVVIILRATGRYFPLIHSDNDLFNIFGISGQDYLDEERRLFYVAVTRARDSLYILTETGFESPFIEGLRKTNPI